MSSILSAELAATCSALGYYDAKSNKYYGDSNTLETVKDLIRYLRRDDETHDIRRQLGETKVLQNDLVPLLRSYWEETDLFDVLLRLLVNLTTPALMLWDEELPTDKIMRNHFLQVEDHLKSYKETFSDETFWAVLSTRLSKILETNSAERGDENSLIIERILILIRNILYVAPDPASEKRPDNDASIHDQVLWALHQSGILDIILYISGSASEKAYYMHTLEILTFMLREQRASELAHAALQRSETEKMRDEAELLSIRHRESTQKHHKMKIYNGARHSRFGGTFVLKSMKSISENELIYHKPLNKLEALNFDADKKKPKTANNRMPVVASTLQRRSPFSIRLFLKEFCVEFLNSSYNAVMYHVKDNLVRARAQDHDESYYLWALRFFMEFNRCYSFEINLVSETMSVQTFRYVQKLMENYFDMIQTDKKKFVLWSRRLHLALLAYRELLLTICVMDKSVDGTVRDSARVIKSNIFYILEYREFIITLLLTYDELKMSNAYLKDLMETQHVFVKLLEGFCADAGSVVVQKKTIKKRKKKKAVQQQDGDGVSERVDVVVNLENRWDEVAPQLSVVLEGGTDFPADVIPFDAASDVPIDEQKSEAMKRVQKMLRDGEFESAVGLLRAAREVWPENNCFGSNNMAPEEEFLALRDIFLADLGENEEASEIPEQPVFDEYDQEEEDDEEDDEVRFREIDFKLQDFVKRLARPKVVRACGLALKDFETNSINTNHCIVKLLHRIAYDCSYYVMVFQLSIFRTFQKIYANKDFPQYRELVKFATYIIRQFVRITDVNKKVYMESLFFKDSTEAYEVEHGYSTQQKTGRKSKIRGWSEEEEDELRRLFGEHQLKELETDVVDFVVENLIDNTRSRREVISKLEEMHLLVVSRRIAPSVWLEEDDAQLRELFDQFKGNPDPLRCIRWGMKKECKPKKLIQRLLHLGIIQSEEEVAKKKSARGRKKRPDNDVESDSDNDQDHGPSRGRPTKKTKKVKQRPTARTDSEVANRLINLVSAGMSEALDWLKDSLSDAVEDFESADNCEGIPLVPIMDYAVDAMENADFQAALKALGIAEPFDEQEAYWRISGHLSVDSLNKYKNMLQQAIDNTLTVPEEASTSQQYEAGGNSEGLNSGLETEQNTDSESDHENGRRTLNESDDDDRMNQPRSSQINKKSTAMLIEGDQESDLNSESPASISNIAYSDDETEQNTIIRHQKNVESFYEATEQNTSAVSGNRRKRVIQMLDSDEEDVSEINEEIEESASNSVNGRKLVDSDDDSKENDDSKRNRMDSDSETEKPASKKSRVAYISSDED